MHSVMHLSMAVDELAGYCLTTYLSVFFIYAKSNDQGDAVRVKCGGRLGRSIQGERNPLDKADRSTSARCLVTVRLHGVNTPKGPAPGKALQSASYRDIAYPLFELNNHRHVPPKSVQKLRELSRCQTTCRCHSSSSASMHSSISSPMTNVYPLYLHIV